MSDVRRFLGCAFAAADLLIELDADGLVVFAAGATGGAGNPTGRRFLDLFDGGDRAFVSALIDGLEDGRRVGPMAVAGAAGSPFSRGSLCAFRLPGFEGRTSCSLTLSPLPAALGANGASRDGLYEPETLEELAAPVLDAARSSGSALEVAMVRFNGLAEALNDMSAEDAARMNARVAGAVRAESWAGAAAARLGPEKFAVLRQPGDAAETTAGRLARVVGVAAHAVLTAIDPMSDRAMKVLRMSLDAFARDPGESGDLSRHMETVLAQAGRFESIVAERRFRLAYQPVVRLTDRVIHHFETLVRFEDADQSPYEMIRMAEQLDIIEKLDCAVMEDAIARLRSLGASRLSLAVNVSGRSLVSDRFLNRVHDVIGLDVAGRLMIELTESSEVDDLDEAARRLQSFRDRGIGVCLDDFGVGAAAFDYIRRLPVDAVKIDGRYVREMDKVERSRALVNSVVRLCRDLNVETVAEYVETTEVEAALKSVGVDYGQGYLYGQPAPEPVMPRVWTDTLGDSSGGSVAVRRRGGLAR